LDAEGIEEEGLDADPVGDGDGGEGQAIGPAGPGVDRGRAGGAVATAQAIGAHDEEPVGVDGFAWADHGIPPARVARAIETAGGFGVAVPAGDVGVAGEGVFDEDDVIAGLGELTVGLVFDDDGRDGPAAFEG